MYENDFSFPPHELRAGVDNSQNIPTVERHPEPRFTNHTIVDGDGTTIAVRLNEFRSSFGKELVGDGEAHFAEEEFHVFPYGLFGGGVAEEVGGVVGAEDLRPTVEEEAAAHFRDGLRRVEEVLGGDGSPADDEVGIDDSQLSIQPFAALRGFFGGRIAIPGGTAAEDIADVQILAFELHGFDDFIHELSGTTDKRFALLVFVGAGGFAEKQESGFGISDAEHGLSAGRGEFLTAGAIGNLTGQLLQLCQAIRAVGSRFFGGGIRCHRGRGGSRRFGCVLAGTGHVGGDFLYRGGIIRWGWRTGSRRSYRPAFSGKGGDSGQLPSEEALADDLLDFVGSRHESELVEMISRGEVLR